MATSTGGAAAGTSAATAASSNSILSRESVVFVAEQLGLSISPELAGGATRRVARVRAPH